MTKRAGFPSGVNQQRNLESVPVVLSNHNMTYVYGLLYTLCLLCQLRFHYCSNARITVVEIAFAIFKRMSQIDVYIRYSLLFAQACEPKMQYSFHYRIPAAETQLYYCSCELHFGSSINNSHSSKATKVLKILLPYLGFL